MFYGPTEGKCAGNCAEHLPVACPGELLAPGACGVLMHLLEPHVPKRLESMRVTFAALACRSTLPVAGTNPISTLAPRSPPRQGIPAESAIPGRSSLFPSLFFLFSPSLPPLLNSF